MQQTNIFAEIDLMKLSFDIYKYICANEPPDKLQTITQIYKNLKDAILDKQPEVQPETQTHDLYNINIVDSFPCVDIAPIYSFSTQENGLIAAITKVLIIEKDIPEIANKGVYVQEVYVNTINADYKTIFEFISIPENAIIKLPYVGDTKLYGFLSNYHIEFYPQVIKDTVTAKLTTNNILSKGLYVVSEIGSLSRNLLSELNSGTFEACLRSLSWFGIEG